MRYKMIDSAIVVDKGKVLGIDTERDLVNGVLIEDRGLKTVKIGDVISATVVSISPKENA